MEAVTPTPKATQAPSRAPDTDVTLPWDGKGPIYAGVRYVHGVKLAMQHIFEYLREGRNLGPLSVLVLVLIYSLLSPHLPAPIHDYIYHIAH